MEILYPFNEIFELFCFAFLSLKLDLRYEKELLVEIFNSQFKHCLTIEHVDALVEKFMFLSKTDFSKAKLIFNSLQKMLSKRKRFVTPPIEFCLSCKKYLVIENKKEKITYTKNGSLVYDFISLVCLSCDTVYETDRYSKQNKTYFYPEEKDDTLEFICLSRQTAFEVALIENNGINVTINAVSFEAEFPTKDFFSFLKYTGCQKKGALYAVSRFTNAYNEEFQLKNHKALYRKRLSEIWFSDINYCKSSVVFDGHQKCSRLRCLAEVEKEVYCEETPIPDSYFCFEQRNFRVDDKDELFFFIKRENHLKNTLLVDFSSIINHRDNKKFREYQVKSDNGCNLEDGLCFNKKKTWGLLTGLAPCGLFISFCEIVIGESIKSLWEEVLKSCQLHEHRAKHHNDDQRTNQLTFLIDSFHLSNHTRKKCHENHNLKKHKELEGINSQICEQTFRLDYWIIGLLDLSNFDKAQDDASRLGLCQIRLKKLNNNSKLPISQSTIRNKKRGPNGPKKMARREEICEENVDGEATVVTSRLQYPININIRLYNGRPGEDFEQWLAEFKTKTSRIEENCKMELFKAYMGSKGRECMEGLNEQDINIFDKLKLTKLKRDSSEPLVKESLSYDCQSNCVRKI
ncbi:hypothetical protein BpHYR1_017455 [Brachionus plicatilis]|uniref:Uncharacterized protein n=1 Tax=Brachionus plicatilis TaxID=10195 RepID=A0A3M7SN33_BRAPC|nr:hypothetical protein BpHYR1_017455 [Brachionus plicatilis]